MSYEIIESAPTQSGKWQVRVVISPDESAFFKFDTEPSQAEVDRQAEIYTLNKQLASLQNTALPIAEQEPVSTRLSKLDYMNRFTDAELVTIYTVAKSSVQVEVWLEKFKVAEFINRADPTTIAGLQALEAAGLIAPGRASAILA